MSVIYAMMAFIGSWLLYVFPLYQFILEAAQQQKIIRQFRGNQQKYPEVSPWYWLIPPLKLKYEKERSLKILRDKVVDRQDFDQIYLFLNKGTAWFYIAVAGALNGFVATRGLLDSLKWQIPWLGVLLINGSLLALGIIHVQYRMSHQRRQRFEQKLK